MGDLWLDDHVLSLLFIRYRKVRKSTEKYGKVLKSMEKCGKVRKSTEKYGKLRKSTEKYGKDFWKEWVIWTRIKSLTQTQIVLSLQPEMEFKEFERRLKFKPRLKYGWFHLKMFQDLGRRSIETGFWRI